MDFIPLRESKVTVWRQYLKDDHTVQYLPTWLPFARFKKIARDYKAMDLESLTFNWAKKLIVRLTVTIPCTASLPGRSLQASGNYIESFVSQFLHRDGQPTCPSAEEEDTLKWCSAALYLGGADTVRLSVRPILSYHATNKILPDRISDVFLLLPHGHVPGCADTSSSRD